MKKNSVYCIDNSDRTEVESSHRGYRDDIFVCVDGQIFNVIIYDIVRLQQDFETRIQEEQYFDIEPNIVLVREVKRENIIFTLEKLQEDDYFGKIKPVDRQQIEELDTGEIFIKHEFWGNRKLIKIN